jgi:hypothetical protein
MYCSFGAPRPSIQCIFMCHRSMTSQSQRISRNISNVNYFVLSKSSSSFFNDVNDIRHLKKSFLERTGLQNISN